MSDVMDAALAPERALDVLLQLQPQLQDVVAGQRAIVGLRAAAEDHIELVDVDLASDGTLDASGTDALVVVTSEDVGDGDDVVSLTQLACILPGGTEVGISRVDGAAQAKAWRTDQDASDAADELRPHDVAANTARRAFGLPSVIGARPSVAGVIGRAWLVTVAAEALRRFDAPEGVRDVAVEELSAVANAPLLGGLVSTEAALPSWEQLHAHAATGRLELGPFTVHPSHAAWLDVDGLAQVVDTTLPIAEDLLEQLQLTAGDAGMAWALTWLIDRGWHEQG